MCDLKLKLIYSSLLIENAKQESCIYLYFISLVDWTLFLKINLIEIHIFYYLCLNYIFWTFNIPFLLFRKLCILKEFLVHSPLWMKHSNQKIWNVGIFIFLWIEYVLSFFTFAFEDFYIVSVFSFSLIIWTRKIIKRSWPLP